MNAGRRGGPRRGAVRQYPPVGSEIVAHVTITSGTPPSLGQGDTFQLVWLVESGLLPSIVGPQRVDLTATRTVTFLSGNTGVVTVNSSGLVTYVGAGSTTVTLSCEGTGATESFTGVSPAAAVASVSVSPASFTLAAGAIQVLAATPRDSGGNFLPGRTVTWGTSDGAVATVGADSGNDNHTVSVTGVGDGSCTITATCETVPGTSAATVSSLATYRGANLPIGMTAPGSLASAFGGAPWSITDLIIGSGRYNAATELVVSTTGSQGRTDLLAHLATAAAGSVDYRIILPTGTLSGGIYTLPAKTNVAKHCWLVTTKIADATFATARGTKIPASTTGMTILQGPASVTNNIMVFADSGNARGYSLHGVVVQNDQTSAAYDVQLGIVEIRRTSNPVTIDGCSGRFYMDRSWLRGSPTTDVRRGIYANGPYLWVEDSRITDIHTVGNESAGIGGFSGSQFHVHKNTTIEAASQAIIYGGADPYSPQTNTFDPADIFTDKVYALKPLSWLTTHGSYAGIAWTVKTGFEAKNMRRWVIDRSITQNNWPSAQTGYAMLFQNLSDNNTNHLENRVEDVVVRHHKFDYVAQGINLLSRVAYGGGTLPVNKMNRMVFDNIGMTKVGGNNSGNETVIKNGSTGSVGTELQILSDIQNLTIDRLTSDGSRATALDGTGGTNWILTNLVQRMGTYGWFRTGGLTGQNALNASVGGGYTADGNVGYDHGSSNTPYPAPNWDTNETNASMLFVDYVGYNYRLTTGHTTKGVSGGVPGCDWDALDTAVTGVAD